MHMRLLLHTRRGAKQPPLPPHTPQSSIFLPLLGCKRRGGKGIAVVKWRDGRGPVGHAVAAGTSRVVPPAHAARVSIRSNCNIKCASNRSLLVDVRVNLVRTNSAERCLCGAGAGRRQHRVVAFVGVHQTRASGRCQWEVGAIKGAKHQGRWLLRRRENGEVKSGGVDCQLPLQLHASAVDAHAVVAPHAEGGQAAAAAAAHATVVDFLAAVGV